MRVFCGPGWSTWGRVETNPWELFLHLSVADHTEARPYPPRTNRALDRLNYTFEEELYRVTFRKKLCRTLDGIEADLDE